MTLPLIVALAFALVASVIALTREIRLRRALQRLLHYLLTHWKANAPPSPEPKKPDCAVSTTRDDQRL